MVCEARKFPETKPLVRGEIQRWRVRKFWLQIDLSSWRFAGYTIRAISSSDRRLQPLDLSFRRLSI